MGHMNGHRGQIRKISICLGLLLLILGRTLHGQQSAADEKQFSETQARAAKGDAQSQFMLGYYYSVGFGVTTDAVKAVMWYRKAADQNLAGAQYDLGECYDHGLGVASDMVEAAKWYRKAGRN
jgi:TPR repeat protein